MAYFGLFLPFLAYAIPNKDSKRIGSVQVKRHKLSTYIAVLNQLNTVIMANKRGSKRLFLHTKDVIELTGRGYKSSLAILREIRQAYDKPKNALVSIAEFCSYMNVEEHEVLERLT